MNQPDYNGRQKLKGVQKVPALELPRIPVPIVPDLSLIDYNDCSNIQYIQSYGPSVLQTKTNELVVAEQSQASLNDKNQQQKDTDSYVAWRTKNSHLFNKSSLTTSTQNSDKFYSKSTLPSKQGGNHDHSSLLNKITEISGRLEKEVMYEDKKYIIPDHQQQLCSELVPVRNENENNDLRLYENDDSYKRVKELYDKIFPSEKLKPSKYNTDYECGLLTHGNNKEQIFETLENRNRMGNKDCSSGDGIRLPDVKKKVTYECDDLTKVADNSSNCNYVNGYSNKRVLSRYDNYPFNAHNGNHEESYDSASNYSNSRQDSSHPSYHYPKPVESLNGKEVSSGMPTQKVISYDLDNSRHNFKRYSTPKNLEYDKRTRCLCPQCPENDSSKDLLERCKAGHRKHNKKTISESNSSSEDNPVNKYCCYEKYKKKKKKKITVDELYNIVKLQNEQINLLQKQIDRLLEQNYGFKKLLESKQIVQQDLPNQNEENENSAEKKCSCQNSNNVTNNNGDKFTTQGFTFSVVQENSKIEQQNFDSVNGNIKKCTNVSIGVMTSFVELTQKMQGMTPQQFSTGIYSNQNFNNDGVSSIIHDNDNRKDDYSQPRGKKPAEISATRFGRGSSCPVVAEESFTLNEVDLPTLPVQVNEHVPTPQCSVHVDMQDYGSTTSSSGSSDDDDSENNAEDRNASDDGRVGWTLYDNVVGQVNKILQRNGPPPNDATNSAVPVVDDVRNATIQQLRRLGVSFLDNDTSAAKKVTFDPVNYPVINGTGNHYQHRIEPNGLDANRKMDELPLKYLNEEQILQAAINIMNKKKESANVVTTVPEDNVPAYGNNDVSFATMKYLERYRLLPSNSNNQELACGNRQQVPQLNIKKQTRHRIPHQLSPHQQRQQQQYQQLEYNEQRPQNLLSNKILDITALKQQPKLL